MEVSSPMAFLAASSSTTFLRHIRTLHSSPAPRLASLTIRHFAPKTKRIKKPKSLVAPPGTPHPQNIAIVGGGLAGLAVTYHLLHSTSRYARKRGFDADSLRLTILDPHPPGRGGASAAAAGLLHPFTPRVKKKAWKPVRSMDAALRLVQVAQERTPHRDIVRFSGLLRLALTEKMETDFRQAANRFPTEIDFLEPAELRERYPSAPEGVCAAFIKHAAVVDTSAYLENLWRVCQATGRVQWQAESVDNVAALLEGRAGVASGTGKVEGASSRFDTVILCAGASIKGIQEVQHVPLTPCRGQNLILESARPDAILSTPLISGKYIVPDYFGSASSALEEGAARDGAAKRVIAGATFEYRDSDESEAAFLQQSCKTDTERATLELEEPLHRLAPNLFDTWTVTGTSSGTRALPPRSVEGSIPIAGKVSGTAEDVSCWVFTGLGSRGLLHHAYLGRLLAHAVVAGNEKLIHVDARRFPLEMRTANQ